MNFDEILDLIGGFGKFQKLLYVWICVPQIFLAFHMLVSVFTGAVPPHVCRPSEATASMNLSLSSNSEWSCVSPINHTLMDGRPTGRCQGWDYSHETFQSTIVSEVSQK